MQLMKQIFEAFGYSSRYTHVEHITVVYSGDDLGMSNCEQSLMIQDQAQLIHKVVQRASWP